MHIELIDSILIMSFEIVALEVSKPLSSRFRTYKLGIKIFSALEELNISLIYITYALFSYGFK